MKVRTTLITLVLLAACSSEREAAIAVRLSVEPNLKSTHALVTASGGAVSQSTACMKLTGKSLTVGVIQGSLPDDITLSARGFDDATCTGPTSPPESAAPVDRRFRKGLILDATLLLRRETPAIETNCANGVDDDQDGQLDCADQDCTDRACTTGNVCVAGQTCQAGSCQGGQSVTCDSPPSSCFSPAGLCVVGVGCRYLINAGDLCDAGNDCMQSTRCDATGACTGPMRACTQPPAGQCWSPAGLCVPDAGCTYQPAVDAGCDDNDNCTLDDRCDVDAGCRGTPVTCAPRECGTPSGACAADGGCLYTPSNPGMSCSDGGTCNVQGGCLPPFPFVPSNVAINDLPTPAPGKATFNCGTTTIDTGASGAPTITNPCPGLPALGSASITQPGGLATVVIAFEDLEISGGSTLAIVGARPAILVSMKDILVLGAVQVAAGAQACSGAGAGANGGGVGLYKSGGGGGGFATAGAEGGSVSLGANGGAAGGVNLGMVLRGGCPGGSGGGSNRPAAGGGALQLVARQLITVAGVINAPGQGGEGGGFGNGGNGGGSGGDLLLEAQQVVASSGALTCNGGGGGEASTSNAGQPGQLTQMPARGGSDMLAGGAGGDGASSTAVAEAGEGSSLLAGGGGGGGGLGRIRIKVTNGCNIGPQVVFSPAATSNQPDAGCP